MWISSLLLLLVTVTAANAAACNLRHTLPQGCDCNDRNVTCTKVWPTKDQIPQDVISLTITQCNMLTLGTSIDTFGELQRLEILNLTDNNIMLFESASSFHHHQLPVLRELILDQNNLVLNHHQVFNGLSNMEVLSLRSAFNNSKQVFTNLNITFHRSSLESLQALLLDDNNFGFLGANLFEFDGGKASGLQKISLRNCGLYEVSQGIFKQKFTPELNFIDLSMNKIMYFDNELKPVTATLGDFDKFGSQLTLDLTDNPYQCDCELIKFRQWLNTTSVNLVDVDSLTCRTAENTSFVGRSIVSLDDDDLECNPMHIPTIDNQMKLPYIILSIIFGIIGLLFLIIMYMRRGEIDLYIRTTGTAIKEVFCSSKAGYSDIGRVAQRTEVPAEAAPALPAEPADV